MLKNTAIMFCLNVFTHKLFFFLHFALKKLKKTPHAKKINK